MFCHLQSRSPLSRQLAVWEFLSRLRSRNLDHYLPKKRKSLLIECTRNSFAKFERRLRRRKQREPACNIHADRMFPLCMETRKCAGHHHPGHHCRCDTLRTFNSKSVIATTNSEVRTTHTHEISRCWWCNVLQIRIRTELRLPYSIHNPLNFFVTAVGR